MFPLLLCYTGFAQVDARPLIGSDPDIKDKVIVIKDALPDLVKAFGKNGETSGGFTKFQTDFAIGKSTVSLTRYDPKMSQEMDIVFSHRDYAGTKDDFKNFFDQLVKDIQELFGKTYYSNPPSVDLDIEMVSFFEKGKGIDNSPTEIDVVHSLKFRDVSIEFKTERKEN